MAKVYTKCISDDEVLIKMCGAVTPLLLNGLGYGFLAALTALTAGAIAVALSAAAGNPAAAALAIAVTTYALPAFFYAGFFEGMCEQWLNRRLICLEGDDIPDVENECAMGRVVKPEKVDEEFSNFDLDAFVNLQLMPHLADDDAESLKKSQNYLYTDGFQGERFLRRRLTSWNWESDAGDHRKYLHCEFESDYWVKICQVSKVLAPLVPVLTVVISILMEAVCHAVLGFLGFLAPLVCTFIAALLAVGVIALLNLALGRAIADLGSSTDANVGDLPEKPLDMNEKIIIIGRFVYDSGHCTGWHELHPVQKFMRVPDNQYLERGGDKAIYKNGQHTLTDSDMLHGLDSPAFRTEAEAVKKNWCEMLKKRTSPATTGAQQQPINRWTIHPVIDGCQESSKEKPPVIG